VTKKICRIKINPRIIPIESDPESTSLEKRLGLNAITPIKPK
jgi:hypothetical protein